MCLQPDKVPQIMAKFISPIEVQLSIHGQEKFVQIIPKKVCVGSPE